MKDNYFRTSSSSSDDEYDSDDSTRKGDNALPNATTISNLQNKSQPLVGTLINTAVVATAVAAAATSTSIQPSNIDGKR